MQNSTLSPILNKATPTGWLWFLRVGVSMLCLVLIAIKLGNQPFPPQFASLVAGTWPAYALCALLVLEAYKWYFGCRRVYAITFRHAVRATLRGISLGFPLTSAVGDYAGKLMGLPRRRSPVLVPVMTLHSFSQYLVSFLGGVAGVVLWHKLMPAYVPFSAVVGVALLGLILCIAYLFFVPGTSPALCYCACALRKLRR